MDDLFDQVQKYTLNTNYKSKIRNFAQNTPEGFEIKKEYIKYGNEKIKINEKPVEICKFICERLDNGSCNLYKVPELPSEMKLSGIRKHAILNSLVRNYAVEKIRELKIGGSKQNIDKLESFIKYHILNNNIDTSMIDVINSRIVEIKNIGYNGEFYLTYSQRSNKKRKSR